MNSKVAFTGYARAGKDAAAKALIDIGYTKHAFGDIIKERLSKAEVEDFYVVKDWMKRNSPEEVPLVIEKLATAFSAITTKQIDPFTENDLDKEIIRTALEYYGEAHYDSILKEFLATVPEFAVNTKLLRIKEAVAWKKLDGIIIEIANPNRLPASTWEAERLNELRESGFIDCTIHNLSTLEVLHKELFNVLNKLP